MKKLPPLNAVRAFAAAARHASFKQAAAELHVTDGAIGRQVALLESWLGTPLFQRTSSGLVLTEVGSAYEAEVRASLGRLGAASMAVRDGAQPDALRVSAPPTFSMRWLIPRLAGFKRPRRELLLTTSLAPVAFAPDEYDVAVRGGRQPLPGCRSEPFMHETVVPVCSVALARDGGLRGPGDLARHTLLTYHTELYRWADWFQASGHDGLPAAATLDFEEMFFALQAAADGLGVVLVPLALVLDDLADRRLCAPFGRRGALQRQYYAHSRATGPLHHAADDFHAWLCREGGDTDRAVAQWFDKLPA